MTRKFKHKQTALQARAGHYLRRALQRGAPVNLHQPETLARLIDSNSKLRTYCYHMDRIWSAYVLKSAGEKWVALFNKQTKVFTTLMPHEQFNANLAAVKAIDVDKLVENV